MNPAHLKLIALGVGALVLIWAASALLPSGTDRAETDFLLPPVVADSVDTVSVTAPAETLVVARAAAGGWTVNGFPASSTAVEQLFSALQDAVHPALVARSATSFARLGVDTASARRLTVSGHGRTQLALLVSERGPDGGGAYVRLATDSAVYAWPLALASAARRRLDDWRDRVIATVVPDSVRRVTVERGARRYTVERRDSGWTFTGGAVADSAAVARLLDRFRTLNAGGFPTAAQLDSAFRGRPERRVALFGPGDTALLTLDFDSTAGGFWARRAVGGTVYRIYSWEADQLTPADSTLRR